MRRLWIAAVPAVVAVLLVAAHVIRAQHVHAPSAPAPEGSTAPTERGGPRILYWYDPMHPQYHSDKPGTAPDCGMDLIPKYADERDAAQTLPPGAVQISPLRQQLSGIRTAPVTRRRLTEDIRTVGVVQPDETRVHKVRTKFPGWVDKLFVNFTGQSVRAGDPIIAIYSPELVSTQTEYLLARRGNEQLHESPFAGAAEGAQSLLQAARRRLLLWDITPQQIRELEETGKPQTAVTLHSPVSGYVTAKDVYQGLYVTPDTDLYTVTDLSRVWVVLDVYEYEMRKVLAGTPVSLSFSYHPGETFPGVVSYVYPYLDGKTRTNKVRVELDNRDERLKPEMYGTAEIHARLGEGLTVPADAVLDSGSQQVVFVATGDGRFEPRRVKLGPRAGGYVEVLEGVREGEPVVVAANFMVDSESQLKAALNAMTADQTPAAAPQRPEADTPGPQTVDRGAETGNPGLQR
jgi:Cu(I)/Ag(I) efflux system membrane fusion protein